MTLRSVMLEGSSALIIELTIESLSPIVRGFGTGVTISTNGSKMRRLLLYRDVRRLVSTQSMVYESFFSINLLEGAILAIRIET